MTLQYLVDTDWAIHYLRGKKEIVERLQHLKINGLALSILSFAELYEGVYYSKDPAGSEQNLQDFLRGLTIIGLDEEICKIFGKERGRLRTKRTLIGDVDLFIGATARHHHLTVLTNNRHHFERIEGIQIESL